VLEPFARSRPDELPSCLCVLTHRTRTGYACLDEDLERIASMPPDQLVDQLPDNEAWEPVARQPTRWLHRFAHVMGRSCRGLQGPWRRAAGMLDREAERVEAAIARGAERELIALRLPDAVVELDSIVPHAADVADRLAIVLMLGGAGSGHAWSVDGKITHVVYPVAGAWRLVDETGPPPPELEALLGAQRARLLQILDRPTTAGRLADTLHAVPSAATHHVAILERAGLVERERDGRRVVVHRTARGTELLALYAPG
jgi:DNA-binding transcriptional ArsR family regulator